MNGRSYETGGNPRPIVTGSPSPPPRQGIEMRTFIGPDRGDFAELADFAASSPFCHLSSEIDLQFLQDRTLSPTGGRSKNRAAEFANQMSDRDARRKQISHKELTN
jgi:hypothetical protein